MRNIVPLSQRELASTFFSPVAYVVGFIFLIVTGYAFLWFTLVPGNEASMRPLFRSIAVILVFTMPLLTMRTVADEFASGTIETLMTAPVTDGEVILGKFLGVLAFYCAMLATTLFHLAIMAMNASPEGGAIVFGYVGLILMGALYTSVGVFASCCTRHQLLAAIIAIGVLSVFTVVVDQLALTASPGWRVVLAHVNVLAHFDDFAKGILDTSSIVFFITTTAFFLLLATKVLESRRWR